ncbi:hypothetical protein [Gottfriedia acidiceleris]|uniref:hypothetical protein n=1 Tax=Gottfriedia acidiceleris TaxID=371036 RepID=UPI0030009FB4
MKQPNEQIKIERVQTGIRMEKGMVKVLKAMAEYHDISLGNLIEIIVLRAFDNKLVFSPDALGKIKAIKEVYGMDYGIEITDSWIDSEK